MLLHTYCAVGAMFWVYLMIAHPDFTETFLEDNPEIPVFLYFLVTFILSVFGWLPFIASMIIPGGKK
jgi:hypothetical protein